MAITKEQTEALATLEENTHVLWSVEGALALTRPFGFDCRTETYKANPRDPKGLALNNGEKEAAGAASWDIFGQIARHVGATRQSCLGRGFQVRADCEAIRKTIS
ncbi:MAG: hypothetical protein ACK4UO_06145 [Pseudolabrys sp.]